MWVARNRDGKYHLFNEEPEYDEWYMNDIEYTIKTLEELIEDEDVTILDLDNESVEALIKILDNLCEE